MLLNQIKDTSFLYFTVLLYKLYAIPLYAILLVTSYKYALYTANKTYLYLDLRATRYFSGLKSDFT